jgi:hypothetical protein
MEKNTPSLKKTDNKIVAPKYILVFKKKDGSRGGTIHLAFSDILSFIDQIKNAELSDFPYETFKITGLKKLKIKDFE